MSPHKLDEMDAYSSLMAFSYWFEDGSDEHRLLTEAAAMVRKCGKRLEDRQPLKEACDDC